jgi:hypothetical protein
LSATILASDIATAGTASVTVVNPSPGGGASNVVFFPITFPITPPALVLSTFGTGSYGPDSIAAADFNGDGKLDLVVANDIGSDVSVLLGNGDGTFQPKVNYTTGAYPDAVVLRDFNGDGKVDIAVRSSQSPYVISVLLGNGDGTFRPAMFTNTNSCSGSLVGGDFNGDGKVDLACTNPANNTVAILLGNGDGTFQNEVDYATGSGPYGVAVGDFNGDGKLDLAVADTADNTVSILLGNGDGTFQPYVEYPVGATPEWVNVADLNGDGVLDLVVVNQNGSSISVLLGNHDGTFKPQVEYPVPAGAVRLEVADLNGDGKLDLAVTGQATNAVSILLGNGNGTFQSPLTSSTGSLPLRVVAGDFNGDGKLDLAIANNGDSSVSVLLENGTVDLSPPSVNFGIELLGFHGLPRNATLTNRGSSTLTISSIAITGADAADFNETNNCGASLPPGGHCTFILNFTPAQLGPRIAALTISDDAPGSPQSVPLSGFGLTSGPNATLSATSLTFALQLVGTTSPAQSVTLTNYGTMLLNITSIMASGDFSQSNTCASSLAPLSSCTISVTFTPTQRGTRSGTLSITDNAPGSPQTVALSGTGTVVKLNPSSLSFHCGGQQRCPPPPQTTTLTNTAPARSPSTALRSQVSIFLRRITARGC